MYSDSCSDKNGEDNTGRPYSNLEVEKNQKTMQTPFTDSKVFHMMEMMGYKSGDGLGKNKQGITLPVQIKSQITKKGLGLYTPTSHEWDFSSEEVTPIENVEWLQNAEPLNLEVDELNKFLKESKPKHSIADENHFCDEQVLANVIKAKNIFEELDVTELNHARPRANPFETIRSVFFMNRAALKMANIDAATNFMFTDIDRSVLHKDNSGPYYFADVCAGPGGFTEYILWRKKWLFKGFGFTLRDKNDFRVSESTCASTVTFTPLYGLTGDGDVCCPENIGDFREKVLHETDQKGVHFMMSDGGFSVEGNENIQEILSKNIYTCQCLVALEVLRNHGHFVTKIFDVFTPFSVGLLYLMYKCFEKICILKPNSSRPANSERYLICYNLRHFDCVKKIRTYLRHVANRLWKLKNNSDLDIVEIVPLYILKMDREFFNYICDSNNRLARRQTISLQKLAAFCRNPSLVEHRQEMLRKQCLEYWRIPDRPKPSWNKFTVEDLLSSTIDKRELLLVHPREVKKSEDLGDIVSDVEDWHYTFMQSPRSTSICNFYAGVGGSKACTLQCNKWVKVKNLQLSRGTLLYGELVKEHSFSESSNVDGPELKYSLHVIDALRLGDVPLGDLKFEERLALIETFCKASNHEFRPNAVRIRPKIMKKLGSLCSNCCLKRNEVTNVHFSPLPVLGYKVNQEFYEVNSVLLLKTNEGQSFHSTYVLRVQLFISPDENRDTFSSMQDFISFVKQKC